MPYGRWFPTRSSSAALRFAVGLFQPCILATQATAHVLTDGSPAGSIVDELKAHIIKAVTHCVWIWRPDDRGAYHIVRRSRGNGGEVFCALYEFQDPEVIDHLAKLQDKANVILSNMPGTTDGTKTNDTTPTSATDSRRWR